MNIMKKCQHLTFKVNLFLTTSIFEMLYLQKSCSIHKIQGFSLSILMFRTYCQRNSTTELKVVCSRLYNLTSWWVVKGKIFCQILTYLLKGVFFMNNMKKCQHLTFNVNSFLITSIFEMLYLLKLCSIHKIQGFSLSI